MYKLIIISVLLLFGNARVDAQSTQRIIALSPHSVEMLFAIGAGDRIIATLEYSDYPEAALTIPRIGNFTGVQIEKVVALQPDIIIAWKNGNKSTDIDKLQSLGFKIIFTQAKDIPAIGDELIRLGELTGLQANARIAADQINARYQQIKQRYMNKQKISVFYQLWHDPLRTVGANNWNQSLINDCNGSVLFDNAEIPYPIVSLEDVLFKNPQVIIIPHHSGDVGAKKEIWDKWKKIDAVKNKKIFTIDGDLLHRFGPRAVDGLELLCQAIDSARIEK